jgi:PBSX family phage terminase large subunit
VTEVNLHLLPKQRDFVLLENPYGAFVGGIGSGKSYALAVWALIAATGRVGSNADALIVPNLGAVLAPTYPMLRDATLRTFLDVAGGAVKQFFKAEMRALLINGSEVLFRSAENFENLRGPNLSWFAGDEGSLYHPDVFPIMQGRLRQGGRQGHARLGMTPKGRNWVYKRFVLDDDPDYALINSRTNENSFLSEAWVRSLERSYGDTAFAAQELRGEFVGFEGLVYPEFDRGRHGTQEVADKRHYRQVIAGVDFGYNNPGVILVAGIDGDGRKTIVHEEYHRQLLKDEWANLAAQVRQTWDVDTFFCDPSDPDAIRLFQDAGCNAVPANNTVLTGIDRVRAHLVVQGDGKPRLKVTLAAPNLMAEFEQYQWMEQGSLGGYREQVKKTNDHTMDSLRYLIMGAEVESGGLGISIESYRGSMKSTDRRPWERN